MKKNIVKYNVIMVIFSLCFIAMTGCTGKKTTDKKQDTVDKTATEAQNETKDVQEGSSDEGTVGTADNNNAETAKPGETGSASSRENTSTSNSATKELPIYTINDDTLGTEEGTSQIPSDSKITAELIVNTVVDELKEHSLDIGIDSVKEDGANVIVSFKADKEPVVNCGETVEATILDSIANSLFDNLPSCKHVIYRKEGKAYESGCFAFDINQAYMSK